MSGANSMDINAELEAEWPNLSKTKYTITSPHTRKYNCLAWAAHEDDRWWSPVPEDDGYWPVGVPREVTLQAFIKVYQTCGYEVCDEETVEPGFEKIAIYAKSDGTPTHVARQLENGMWTSKLGYYEDIDHELEGLVGELYGTVQQLMKRVL